MGARRYVAKKDQPWQTGSDGDGKSEVFGPPPPSTRARANPPADDSDEQRRMKEIAARAQADLESVKKRLDRERADMEIKLTARLVTELIPVLDNFERALRAAGIKPEQLPAEDHHLVGVCMIYRELVAVMGGFGVEAFDPAGEPFDPAQHEALQTVAADGNAGQVVETLARGYRLDSKVLRAARVMVAA